MEGKQKILIADDMETFLKLEKMLLEHSGYEVIMAKSGTEALKKIQTEKPSLVFLDMVMPDITGDTVCRFVKTNKSLQSTPVIMVTTRSDPESVSRCKDAGCDDFLTKPITKKDLFEKINKFLKRSSNE
jgi:CheY-like chemotaxis protein